MHVALQRFGAAGILLAALGCASTGSRHVVPQAALLYLKAANEALQQGQFDQAREQVQALRSMPRSGGLDEAIESMETRILGGELAEKIRKASSLKIEPERVAYGQQAIVTLEIKNPESEPLRFLAPQSSVPLFRERKDGGFFGRLTEITTSTDPYGNQIRDKAERTFSTQEEVVIEPGKSWIQQSRLSPSLDETLALRSYQLLYFLRVPRVMLGERETSFPDLRIGPASMQAMPAGFEPLVADPVGNLKKALATSGEKFDTHVFLCAVLASAEQQKAIVPLLASVLQSSERTRVRAAMAGLRWITGLNENGFDEDRWKAWWASRRKDYEEQGAG